LTRIYSTDHAFERAEYWRQLKSDLRLTPFIALAVFLIGLLSVNFAAMAVLADIIHWVFGRFFKSSFKMKLPAFAIAMALDILAIYVAAKFF